MNPVLLKFAKIYGILFLAVGVLGFIPGIVQPPSGSPALAVEWGHGRLLGLFPVNVTHNLVHILIGIWGIVAARSLAAALTYARGVAIIYGVLTVLGLIPATYTLFGLAPIHGHDVWLHALSAIAAAYFGFIAVKGQEERHDRPVRT
jgi:hypothetical protein